MNVQPYVFFDGKCEEALEFYKGAIGAKVDAELVDRPFLALVSAQAGHVGDGAARSRARHYRKDRKSVV